VRRLFHKFLILNCRSEEHIILHTLLERIVEECDHGLFGDTILNSDVETTTDFKNLIFDDHESYVIVLLKYRWSNNYDK
jgi:hypothetical protein